VFDDSDLIREVSALPPEYPVELRIERNGQVMNERVILAKKALTTTHRPFFSVPEPEWRGLQIDYATALPSFYQQSQSIDQDVNLGVRDVAPNSAAWAAGFRAGDYIVQVGRKRVSTPREFFELVAKNSGEVTIEVISGNRRAVRTVGE
jgi:S1-C subfamily serine protease